MRKSYKLILTSFFSNAHPIKLSTFNQAEPVPDRLKKWEYSPQKKRDAPIPLFLIFKITEKFNL
jgi:hypothetical protein